MKTFKVVAASTSYGYCLVQAEDEQQAWDKARESTVVILMTRVMAVGLSTPLKR
jgi:hypothetical protein